MKSQQLNGDDMAMKTRGLLLGLMSIAMAGAAMNRNDNGPKNIEPYTEEEKKRLDQMRKEIMKKKGVQEFTIDGITVMARNYKNALRKVNAFKKKQA